MAQDLEACKLYKATFPSDDWMGKYIGKNDPIKLGDSPGRQLNSDLHTEIRRCFDRVMCALPGHILKASEPIFDPVYIFKNGDVADWVDSQLEKRGLMVELPPEAFRELCPDFISHCRADAFHQLEWWQWKVTGKSIWIEVIPEALVDGKVPRKSLAEILSEYG